MTDADRARLQTLIEQQPCLGCKQLVDTGPVVWLAEDYRRDGGQIDGPYPMHPPCANAAWPLWEATPEEAATLAREAAGDIHSIRKT